MTEETPMKVVIDLSKPEGQRETLVPLTTEELAQRELDRIAYEEAEAARVAEEDRINTLKTSARAKLVAGEPLTEEEASVLVI